MFNKFFIKYLHRLRIAQQESMRLFQSGVG